MASKSAPRGSSWGKLHDWQDTTLWKELQDSNDDEAEDVRTALKSMLPGIQFVLAHGGTSPLDFTLHDSQHAFRVANRMADIVPKNILHSLSSFELAFLLLSAYLHDIGMSPARELVKSHYEFLLTGECSALSDDAISKFKNWISDMEPEVAVPLARDRVVPTDLQKAESIVARYCRERHVDWSDEWIVEKLSKIRLGTYTNWVSDLRAICRSHNQGYDELISDRFDPKPTGARALIVHLRYVAVVLRIADILEFDPERTPDIIYQHRGVKEASAIYWHKDHHVTATLDRGGRLTVSARPLSAEMHRAIETMIDEIESELRLARRLDDSKPFSVLTGFGAHRLTHGWRILADVRRDVRPQDDAYEYINGAFRPDTKKLLQLLSDRALYGSELVAVRELLQNAFDAVREQIAYSRLEKAHPEDPQWSEKLGAMHRVDLRLCVEANRVWLVCRDDGVGMTKAIIRDHLLVSGIGLSRATRILESRAKRAGFRVGRTGQFGIGVLSYFMIADMVQIRSRRSVQAGDAESTGWFFETAGVGAFGELREDNSLSQGTEVRLRLTLPPSEMSTWFAKLRKFLDDVLCVLPCPLDLKAETPRPFFLTYPYGRVKSPVLSSESIVRSAQINRRPWFWEERPHMLPADLENAEKQSLQAGEKLRGDFSKALKWETISGRLPGSLGEFRVSIPIFQLPSGPSNFFVPAPLSNGEIVLDKSMGDHLVVPGGEWIASWKGMLVKPSVDPDRSWGSLVGPFIGFVEVDWQDSAAGMLSIDRSTFRLTPQGVKASTWVVSQVQKTCREFYRRHPDSPFSSLSGGWRSWNGGFQPPKFWLCRSPQKPTMDVWRRVSFPCVGGIRPVGLLENGIVKWKSKAITTVLPIRVTWDHSGGGVSSGPWRWASPKLPPDRILPLYTAHDIHMVEFWLSEPMHRASIEHKVASRFPPTWTRLAGAQISGFRGETVWNSAHALVTRQTADASKWARETFKGFQFPDPLPLRKFLIRDADKACAWLSLALNFFDDRYWRGLIEKEPEMMVGVWRAVFGSSESETKFREICIWQEHEEAPGLNQRRDVSLWVLTPESSKRITDVKKMKQFLPKPPSEWRLELTI